MGVIRYGAVLVAVMLVVLAGTSWSQAGPEPLFEAAPAPANAAQPAMAPEQDDGRWPQRYVTVNTALLQAPASQAGSAVQLELFDGVRHIASADSVDAAAAGDVVWQGRINDQPEETVTLVTHSGVAAGTIRADGRLYRLTYAGDGVHLLEEIPLTEPAAEHLPMAITLPEGESTDEPASGQATGADDGSVVDVMVVYTPAARIRRGGQAGIEAFINLAVAETNKAYENSQINTRLLLVATAEVSYAESGSMVEDLHRLQGTGEGYMDQVHGWRDAVAADTVTLIQEATDYCGIAYLMTSLSHSFERYAFSVVDSDCATGYYSFGHELGHNMGSTHDRANGNSALFAYSYGYWAPNYSFRTIMAYSCPGGCTRIQHFSNPNVTYQGQPTGVAFSSNPAQAADNARSINDASYTVANWRDSATRLPAQPTGLVAVAKSPSRIDLAWQDNDISEQGFDLQRRIPGKTWTSIANLAANTTSYQNLGLAAETTYEYRVRSYSGSTMSAFSNTAAATTLKAPEVHVGQLWGGGSVVSGNGPANYAWRATVNVLVHDAYHAPVSGATVDGQWSGGASGSATCITSGSGVCSVFKSGLGPEIGSLTFSVSGISHGGDTYWPDHNHDPAGNGTTITLFKPVDRVFLPQLLRSP